MIEWTPIKQGLPEVGESVFVTVQCRKGRYVVPSRRTIDDPDWWAGIPPANNVIAWAPYPEPFKGDI